MRSMSAFEMYLRTGRRPSSAAVEIKFNPWHDPEDGRFTMRGQGRYFGRAAQSERRDHPRAFYGHGGNFGGGGGGASAGASWDQKPKRVQPNLGRGGGSIGGGGATGSWSSSAQRVSEPRLPAAPPFRPTGAISRGATSSSEARMTLRKNGYTFAIDAHARTRQATGEIHLQSQPRSRLAQANAGNPDRRASDDGGHFIAARFNGPRDWFNHFAQDANFNRGAYRALEGQWAKAVQDGKRVFVDIVPYYRGTSMRPYKLIVTWIFGGNEAVREFPNERQKR